VLEFTLTFYTLFLTHTHSLSHTHALSLTLSFVHSHILSHTHALIRKCILVSPTNSIGNSIKEDEFVKNITVNSKL